MACLLLRIFLINKFVKSALSIDMENIILFFKITGLFAFLILTNIACKWLLHIMLGEFVVMSEEVTNLVNTY